VPAANGGSLLAADDPLRRAVGWARAAPAWKAYMLPWPLVALLFAAYAAFFVVLALAVWLLPLTVCIAGFTSVYAPLHVAAWLLAEYFSHETDLMRHLPCFRHEQRDCLICYMHVWLLRVSDWAHDVPAWRARALRWLLIASLAACALPFAAAAFVAFCLGCSALFLPLLVVSFPIVFATLPVLALALLVFDYA